MLARILIIEDDSFSRDLVKYLLESSGYSVMVAENGKEGLSMALVAKPDLIICDLQMPVMNGYEVVQALKDQTDWCRVPVIAVTAFSMRGDRETALAAGFDEHISKPIAPEYFVAQVESFLPTTLRAGRRLPY